MIDIKKIIDNKEEVIKNLNLRNKNYTEDINFICENYKLYLEELKKEEELKSDINKLSKEIGNKKRVGESVDDILKEVEIKKISLSKLDSKKYKENYFEKLLAIPNLIESDVPVGEDENSNEIMEQIGKIPEFDFTPRAHYEIEKISENFKFEKAASISKSRFVITTNFVARLERALANFMLDFHTKNGYQEVAIPFIVSDKTLQASSQLPKFENDLFKIGENSTTTDGEEEFGDNRNFYLIPTAEVVLANLHQDEILKSENLPIYYTAYSQSFRKEAGSAGRDVSGIIRMHQFGKVELFKYVAQENSDMELNLLVKDAAKILDALELPYQIVKLCSGDIGFSAQKTFDLEVWFPSQEKYRECSSCSNVGEFQARRGKIRYKTADGTKKYPHMLNGSGMATGRVLAAILENYQQEDGTVEIPKVLKPYMEN